MSKPFDGSCICGAVRFSIEPPSLFCVHCHCRFCRAAHGAPMVTWLGVSEERFSLVAGEQQVTWYASSKQSKRGFCPTCGTTMFYVSTLSPGEIHVARACIPGEVDLPPVAHVFHDQCVPWLHVGDDLSRVTSDSEILSKYEKIEV